MRPPRRYTARRYCDGERRAHRDDADDPRERAEHVAWRGATEVRSRTASTTTETGWCSRERLEPAGHRRDRDERRRREHQRRQDRERRGLRGLGCRGAISPTIANIHDSEYANASTSPTPATRSTSRRCSTVPADEVADDAHQQRRRRCCARGRRACGPTSTAERAIGSERNRSIRPFCRSSARPTPVVSEPNTTSARRSRA